MSQTKPYTQIVIFQLVILLFCSLLVVSSSCKKDNTGIDALPPTTQEGNNTFGCMINGKAFLPGKKTWSPVGGLMFSDGYNEGEFFYQISATNSKKKPLTKVLVEYWGKDPMEEGTFPLYRRENQNGFTAEYMTFSLEGDKTYSIISPFTGEIIITKVDKLNSIVSGAFWFDAINSKG